MTTSVSRTQALTRARWNADPIEDPEGSRRLGRGPPHDDAIRAVSLDQHVVARPQSGALERLDRERHLVLAGDSRHAFTLS
jgi:hypothetical protein